MEVEEEEAGLAGWEVTALQPEASRADPVASRVRAARRVKRVILGDGIK